MAMSSAHLQDHRLLDWLAVAATSRVVAKVHDDKLDRPPPCTAWRAWPVSVMASGHGRMNTSRQYGNGATSTRCPVDRCQQSDPRLRLAALEPATRAFSARGFRSGCSRPEARSS